MVNDLMRVSFLSQGSIAAAGARNIVQQISRIDPFTLLEELEAPKPVYRFDTPRRGWVLAYRFNRVRIRKVLSPPGSTTTTTTGTS